MQQLGVCTNNEMIISFEGIVCSKMNLCEHTMNEISIPDFLDEGTQSNL